MKGYGILARAFAGAVQVIQQQRLKAAGLSRELCGCISKSGVVVQPCEQHGGQVNP